MLSSEATFAKNKYQGEVATGYDEKREGTSKRSAERQILTRWLDDLPKGTKILDAPIGTGFLIPYYESKGFIGYGLDINQDMIDEATKKVTGQFEFACASVLDIPLPNKAVDVSLMIRLTRWLAPHECQQALRELQRVTKKRIIFNARVRNHPHKRPISLFKSALHPNWRIEKEEEIEEDFLMFQVGKCVG